MEQVETVERRNRVVGWLVATRDFLQDARAELSKVTWPTRQELIDATKRVIIMTLIIGVILGLLDWALGQLLVQGIAALVR